MAPLAGFTVRSVSDTTTWVNYRLFSRVASFLALRRALSVL